MDINRKLRVLLADDHLLVRHGLKRLVDEQPDMTVVAETGDGREALRLAQVHAPDVALVDISMPGWDGIAVAREIARTCPEVRIVAVTRHQDDAFVKRMFDAGADGYVLKQSSWVELVRAIRVVASGEQYVDPSVRAANASSATLTALPAARRGAPLDAHEEVVLRLIAASWTNQQIAEHLTTDVSDVVTLRRTAMQKAGLLTRIQIINYARSRGWMQAARAEQPDDGERT